MTFAFTKFYKIYFTHNQHHPFAKAHRICIQPHTHISAIGMAGRAKKIYARRFRELVGKQLSLLHVKLLST